MDDSVTTVKDLNKIQKITTKEKIPLKTLVDPRGNALQYSEGLLNALGYETLEEAEKHGYKTKS